MKVRELRVETGAEEAGEGAGRDEVLPAAAAAAVRGLRRGRLPEHEPDAVGAVVLPSDVLRVVRANSSRDDAERAQVLEQLPLAVRDLLQRLDR